MRSTLMSIFLMCFSLALAAQTADVMPLASEPHHHLSFHNEYVNVYQVQVAPHDSVLLHRHDFDAISLLLNDSEVTVQAPGKPDIHRKLTAGQIRLQPRGYVHSTTIDGDAAYKNVTIELLLPQDGERNLCFPVIPDKPLNCPTTEATDIQANRDQLQFESNESSVNLICVHSHQTVTVGHPEYPKLVVALDSGLVTDGSTKKPLNSGDFVWLESGKAKLIKNNGGKESHIVVFTFRPH